MTSSSSFHDSHYFHPHPPVPTHPNHTTKKPIKKGGGVRLSTDPQSVAARERRHRISHRLKTLQSLVPGAAKLDTVSLLDHAIRYVHFLNSQITLHQALLVSSSGYDCSYVASDPPPLLLTHAQHLGVSDFDPPPPPPAAPVDGGGFEGEGCFWGGFHFQGSG